MRRAWLALCVVSGCFEDSAPAGSDGPTDATSGASTSASTTQTEGGTTGGDGGTDGMSTGAPEDSTGTPPGSCQWPLEWDVTPRKDVVVLADAMPTNMGALLQAAQDIASDDVHVAVGSRCDEKQGLCGAEGETYEHHAIDGNGDPLEQAADLVAQVTNTRPFVPRHVYVLTTIDTAWSEVDLLADPDLAGAHLHVRLSGEPCDGAPQLEALAEASGGSFVCDDFVGVEVLGPELRMAQPSCEVFGNAARGPTPRMPATELTLQGEAPSGAEAIELGAAAACQNQPDAWTFIDAVVGHVGLCPVTCRDAGAWAPPTLSATVTFTCE